jgi:hypothetical protein
MVKRRAKTWKRATSGENVQASLNLMLTRTLPLVTAETPKKRLSDGQKHGNGRR